MPIGIKRRVVTWTPRLVWGEKMNSNHVPLENCQASDLTQARASSQPSASQVRLTWCDPTVQELDILLGTQLTIGPGDDGLGGGAS